MIDHAQGLQPLTWAFTYIESVALATPRKRSELSPLFSVNALVLTTASVELAALASHTESRQSQATTPRMSRPPVCGSSDQYSYFITVSSNNDQLRTHDEGYRLMRAHRSPRRGGPPRTSLKQPHPPRALRASVHARRLHRRNLPRRQGERRARRMTTMQRMKTPVFSRPRRPLRACPYQGFPHEASVRRLARAQLYQFPLQGTRARARRSSVKSQ